MLYVQCIRYGNTVYMSWEGQTPNQVNAMLVTLGATNVQFIDQETYQVAVSTLHM